MAPLRWSYLGQPVLDEIASVGGDVAEDFYGRLYEVLKAPRSAPRVLMFRNQPAQYGGDRNTAESGNRTRSRS